MKFTPSTLEGAVLIQLDPHYDDRGHFVRFFCEALFREAGLASRFIQMSTSFNRKKGQIRGMHYQAPPYEETKVVRCLRGAVYDVIIDLRKGSRTQGQWQGYTLSAENGCMLYIPKGFAHGYKTLAPETELLYMMDQVYHKGSARALPPDPYFNEIVEAS